MEVLEAVPFAESTAVVDADGGGKPFVAFRDAFNDVRVVALDGVDRVRIGRSEHNDVCLTWDQSVSRSHAELRPAGAGWSIVDDGMSRNGTFVDGVRVARHRRLNDRDVVRIGTTVLVYRCPSATDDQATAMNSTVSPVRLSPAERRVLVALCRPLLGEAEVGVVASNAEIATDLCLSVAGVKSQVRSLFRKLGVEELPQNLKRAELAHRAVQFGLVTGHGAWR